ncbi:MAG: hypothetical protein ACRDTN_00240, partial [Mycobacterium sp.]
MEVISAESTELFVGPTKAPVQLVQVTYTGCAGPTLVRIDGDGLTGEAIAGVDREVVEVPVAVDHPVVGQQRAARVHVAGVSTQFSFTVAEPGWT